MAEGSQTLLEYLLQRNPTVKKHAPKSKNNTQTKRANYKFPVEIEHWKDFTYETLMTMYNGALKDTLDSKFDLHDFSYMPEYPLFEIHDEDSLEALLVKWTHSIICEALTASQNRLERDRDHDVYMVRGGQATNPTFVKNNRRYEPDWAGVQRSQGLGSVRPRNILPGDTKLGSKWSSKKIEVGRLKRGDKIPNWQRPIGQIFTYCVRAEGRYGYILTEEELVVFRVRPYAGGDSQGSTAQHSSLQEQDDSAAAQARASGVLEYKSIPWQEDDPSLTPDTPQLTVNLALWWLHILAAQPSKIDDKYKPLVDLKWQVGGRVTRPVVKGSKSDSQILLTDNSDVSYSASLEGSDGKGQIGAKMRYRAQADKDAAQHSFDKRTAAAAPTYSDSEENYSDDNCILRENVNRHYSDDSFENGRKGNSTRRKRQKLQDHVKADLKVRNKGKKR